MALLLVLAVVTPTIFSAVRISRYMGVATSPMLIVAIGMTLVILARQIDISIGSQFSICAVAAGLLAKTGIADARGGRGDVAAGAMMGAINGALVACLGLPSIVVTLATMVMFRESLRLGAARGVGGESAGEFSMVRARRRRRGNGW